MIVKFPSPNNPNGQVYIVDHLNSGPEDNYGATLWFAKICGMFYQKYFGKVLHPYCGMDDMKPEIPPKKSSSSLADDKFSRFDYLLFEPKNITPQKDSIMCGSWAVLETIIHILTPDAFTTCTPLFENSGLHPEYETRQNLCRFTGNFVELLVNNPKVMFTPLSRSVRQNSLFPDALKLGQFDDSKCVGGESRCDVNEDCEECYEKYPDDTTAKAKVEVKPSDRYPGVGLHAKCSIENQTFLCEYRGDVKNKVDVEGASYVADMGGGYVIDAINSRCLARSVNHSCEPNCAFQKITQYTNGHQSFVDQLWVITIAKVSKDEELVINYDANDKAKSFKRNFPNEDCLCLLCKPVLDTQSQIVQESKSSELSKSVDGYCTDDIYDDPSSPGDDPSVDISGAIGSAKGPTSIEKLSIDNIKNLRITTKHKDSSEEPVVSSPLQSSSVLMIEDTGTRKPQASPQQKKDKGREAKKTNPSSQEERDKKTNATSQKRKRENANEEKLHVRVSESGLFKLLKSNRKNAAVVIKSKQLQMVQEYAERYPVVDCNDISEKYGDNKDYSYEKEELKDGSKRQARRNQHKIRQLNIKSARNIDTAAPYVFKLYEAIRDIALRSFSPAEGHDTESMLNFINKLLIQHSVFVFESHLKYNDKFKEKEIYRVTGFMIVEKHFTLDDSGLETCAIIHLLAVAPEARGYRVATKLIQNFATKYMAKKDIILTLMYPKVMKPSEFDLEMVNSIQKKVLRTRNSSQKKKLEQYKNESTVKFWTNHMLFLIWDHFSTKIRQHDDMSDCLCMFGEKNKIQSVVSGSKFSDNGTILTIDFSNCDSLIVEFDHYSANTGIFKLGLQNNLMGCSNLVQIVGVESDIVDEEVDKQMEELQKTKVLSDKQKKRHTIQLTVGFIIDTLWSNCGLHASLEKRYVNAMERSFTSEGKITNKLVGIKGSGRREVLHSLNNTTKVHHPHVDKEEKIGMALRIKLMSIDDTSVVPERLLQRSDQHVSACTFLSAVLLIRSRDRIKSRKLEVMLQENKTDGNLNNLPFFNQNGSHQSLHSILTKFGYDLKKKGGHSVKKLCSGEFSGLCVCAVNSCTGMSHSIGIDFDRGLVWDPVERKVRGLDESFFFDELSCNGESRILVVAVIPSRRRQGFGSNWIGKRVWIGQDKKSKGDVIYVDKGVAGKGNVMAVLLEEKLEIILFTKDQLAIRE